MAELPTGTVTFLLTDVEGSTALWEAAPKAMRDALARHDALFEQAIQANSGVDAGIDLPLRVPAVHSHLSVGVLALLVQIDLPRKQSD